MSTQELRELLEAELAALSDCEDEETSLDDLEFIPSNFAVNGLDSYVLPTEIEDSDTKLSSLNEWKLLIESAEQADKRFEGLRMSLADGFEEHNQHNILDFVSDEAKTAPDERDACLSEEVIHDEHYDSGPLTCTDSSFGAIVSEFDYSEEANSVLPESVSDNVILEDLRELINHMIEAVERSAPIVRAPTLKPIVVTLDWSLLPKVIEDDDAPNALGGIDTGREQSSMAYFDGFHYTAADDLETKSLNERQLQLKETECNLQQDADIANENALRRKEQLQERKQRMDEELSVIRREHCSILIQFKWRKFSRQKRRSTQLETDRIEREAIIILEQGLKIRKAAEEESRRLEVLRLQQIDDEKRRIAVVEKEEREKEHRRLEEASAAQREAQRQCDREEEVRWEQALENARKKEAEAEGVEGALMQSMELQSRHAWEQQKIQEEEEPSQAASSLCCVCSEKITKKPRRRRPRAVSDVADVFQEVLLLAPAPLSPDLIVMKIEKIEGLKVGWEMAASRAISGSQERNFLHGIASPSAADIEQVLRVESLSLPLTSGTPQDKEVDKQRGRGAVDCCALALSELNHHKEGDRGGHKGGAGAGAGAGAAAEESLLQALASWQQWAADTELSRKLQKSKAIASHLVPAPAPAPALLDKDEVDQLVSFGLRPLNLADTGTACYLDISLGVESLTTCSFLRGFTQLRRLQLNVNKLRSLTGLETLHSLEELSVKDNALCSLSAIGSLRSLSSLSADDNVLNTEGLAALTNLPCLRTLSANTNKLHVFPLLSGCCGLQRLHLYHNSISCLPSSSLAALSSLLHLDLGRNKLEVVCGAALSHCPLLQTLVLSQNLLTSPPSPLYLPNLRNLWLSGNKMSNLKSWLPHRNLGPKSTVTWPLFLPLLEKLHLSDNSLCEIGAAAVCNMPLLVDLDLSFNNLTTTHSLQGLRSLPKLSVLQLHDNPVYCSSSADTAAGELTEWLMIGCLSLRIVSGNVIERHDNSAAASASAATPPVSSSNLTGQAVTAADITPLPYNMFALSDGLPNSATRHRQDILAEFRRTGRWTSPSSALQPLMLDSSLSIDLISPEAGPSIGVLRPSEESQRLMQTLMSFSLDQNVLKAREKVENLQPKYPSNIPVPAAPAGPKEKGEKEERLYWETACVDQLRTHTLQLLDYTAERRGTELPITWMQKRVFPSEEVDSDVVALQADGPLDAQNALPSASVPPSVPLGVVRLQAVWRSRKVRALVRQLLLSARYQDDELDEMLGEEFDLDEALGGCDEYLAPIALRGRWQADPKPYSSPTAPPHGFDHIENLHGTRMVRSLAGGWVDGDFDDRDTSHFYDENGRSRSPSHGNLVYGDHKRKRNSVRALPPCHTVGSEQTPSPHGPEQPFSFSQSLSADGASRPSTSHTDTSSISGSSSRAHSVPELYPTRHGPSSSRSDPNGSGGGPSRNKHSSSSLKAEEQAQTEDWGIRDPKVVQAMLKRNKRMKGFAAAQSNRDLANDSDARYQRSAKDAARGGSAAATGGTTMSWGGGGAAGACSSTGSGRGRGGMGKGGGRFKAGRKSLPPAWALMSRQDEAEEG